MECKLLSIKHVVGTVLDPRNPTETRQMLLCSHETCLIVEATDKSIGIYTLPLISAKERRVQATRCCET